MLLDRNTAERIEEITILLALHATTRMIGLAPSQHEEPRAIAAEGFLTTLEFAYVTGKVAGHVGTEEIKKLPQAEILNRATENNLNLNLQDRLELLQLKQETDLFIKGRKEEWRRKIQQTIVRANRAWLSALERGNLRGEEERATARERAKREVKKEIAQILGEAENDLNRIHKTEIMNYLNHGTVKDLSPDAKISKEVDENACEECQSLHRGPDGKPKIHRLGDVITNSNQDLRPYAWTFTIGPTHPFCFCTIRIEP